MKEYTEDELRELGYEVERDALQEYVNLCNDENSEYCQHLLDFLNVKDYGMNKKIYRVLMDDVNHWLLFFKENFEIVEREETRIDKWKELEYKYE